MQQFVLVNLSGRVKVLAHHLLGFYHDAVANELDANCRENGAAHDDDQQKAQDELGGYWYLDAVFTYKGKSRQASLMDSLLWFRHNLMSHAYMFLFK